MAVVEKDDTGRDHLLYSTCLSTPKSNSFAERLGYLDKELEAIVKEWRPSSAGIERLFFTTNQKTAMQVAEVRGMVLALLARKGIHCDEYTPGQVKAAVTGNGKADKKAVGSMLALLLPGLKMGKHDDEADAIAVALTHLASNKHT